MGAPLGTPQRAMAAAAVPSHRCPACPLHSSVLSPPPKNARVAASAVRNGEILSPVVPHLFPPWCANGERMACDGRIGFVGGKLVRRSTGFAGTIVQRESPGEHLSAWLRHRVAVSASASCLRMLHGRVCPPCLRRPRAFARGTAAVAPFCWPRPHTRRYTARAYAAVDHRVDGIDEKVRPHLKV